MTAAGPVDRYPALDGFRALAMLSVFSFHSVLRSSELAFDKWRLLPGVVWYGNAIMANLNLGVAMFFALSGFLIYRPFAAAHIEGRRPVDVRTYARRRAVRIYPAYWLVFLVLLATGAFAGITALQVVLNLLLVQTWFGVSAKSGMGQAWTLVVEVAFYAFVPLWSIVMRRIARGRDALRFEIAGAVLLIVVGFAVSWSNFQHHAPFWYSAFLPHLAALAPGMLLAIVSVKASSDQQWGERLSRGGRYPILWWLAAAAVFWFLCTRAVSNPFFTPDIHGLGWQDMLQPVVAFLLLTPLVIAPRAPGALHRMLSWRVIAWLGVISYGLYLWHIRIINLDLVQRVMQHSGRGRGYAALLAGTLLALGLTSLVAAASWYGLERPLIRRAQRRPEGVSPRLAAGRQSDR